MPQDLTAFALSHVWPKRVRNRRLAGTTQSLAALLAYRTEVLGQSMALGSSREPPAFTFPSRNT
jgi:hypothetical protein